MIMGFWDEYYDWHLFMVFQEKEALEEMLQQSQESLEESKSYIGQLRSQQKDEKRERARYVEAVYEFVTRIVTQR